MSLAAVGSGQHFNIPEEAGPGGSGPLALYFRYAPHLYSLLLFILCDVLWQ
jgi:hypothetical protein